MIFGWVKVKVSEVTEIRRIREVLCLVGRVIEMTREDEGADDRVR